MGLLYGNVFIVRLVLLAVFAYVGGLYFFLRTTLNAFIKCVRVVLLISFKYMRRLTGRAKHSSSENTDGNGGLPLPASTKPDKSRVSLLASLPKDYLGASTTVKEQITVN